MIIKGLFQGPVILTNACCSKYTYEEIERTQ